MVDHPFPIDEIDNITLDSKNIHSIEMITQSEIRMISFDGCSAIIEVSRFMIISIIVYELYDCIYIIWSMIISFVCICLRDHRKIQ